MNAESFTQRIFSSENLQNQPRLTSCNSQWKCSRYTGMIDCSGDTSVSSNATPNNGMHPTADTTAVKFLQSCGAAGDAGRQAVFLPVRDYDKCP